MKLATGVGRSDEVARAVAKLAHGEAVWAVSSRVTSGEYDRAIDETLGRTFDAAYEATRGTQTSALRAVLERPPVAGPIEWKGGRS